MSPEVEEGAQGALTVASPLPGVVLALGEVPDPVFAQALVGDGAAVMPEDDAGVLTAVAPVDGRVVKVMPHAYIVQHASGPAVLVHVGIDTVHLKGEGFTVRAAKGDEVRTGDPMVDVDVAFLRGRELSPCCPVVVLDSKQGTVAVGNPGAYVLAGQPLFSLPRV
ncbi:PTS glucose transporter subunit IIA [Arthrobacter sp.]|uniref:PTS sugar transporter subunit IIA n=1 Tax=Arthrobacter sp. TaxID=1667 RepID=UPI0028127E03|nr:PTS glucose transporter subunit IIA [Arthrobacter sp.]